MNKHSSITPNKFKIKLIKKIEKNIIEDVACLQMPQGYCNQRKIAKNCIIKSLSFLKIIKQ